MMHKFTSTRRFQASALALALAATVCFGSLVSADNRFTDVPDSHWAHDAIEYVVDEGLFAGTSETTFNPEGTMTRAMLWVVLARMDDVNTNASSGEVWYQPGLDWAVENGISDGTNPNNKVEKFPIETTTVTQYGSILENVSANMMKNLNVVDGTVASDANVMNYSGTPQGSLISPILANIYLNELDVFMAKYAESFNCGKGRKINPAYKKPLDVRRGKQEWLKRNSTKISEEKRQKVMAEIQELNNYLSIVPYSDPMDTEYKRVVYVRYADDFLIGVIGSKEDAKQVKIDVGEFIKEQLHLEMSPEKTLITHGNDFARFLGYLVTVSREQNRTRTKNGFTRRTYVGKVKLYVPKEKWLNRLLSYGALKISYDKAHGNKEVWEPVRRPGLIRLDDIEILNQYNAEVRGMYNYYRLANNATVLNAFVYVMKYSMYKTFAGKYRTSMRKIIRKYCRNKDFTVSYQTKSGTKSVVFYNQGVRRNDKVIATENPDIIGRTNENRRYTRLTDRLQGHVCEFCGAETEDIEIHHIRKLKDLSGRAEWERHMIARKRKTMALCHSCHVKLHNGKLD